jgi:hypothetical protein
MPFQRPPRLLSVLASALAAAGIVLAVAGCSHITPLGTEGTHVSLPPPRHLGSPIIVQLMRSQPRTPTGRCPTGSIDLFGLEPNVLRAAVASSPPCQWAPPPPPPRQPRLPLRWRA